MFGSWDGTGICATAGYGESARYQLAGARRLMLSDGVPASALTDGGHACCYYDSDEEQRAFLAQFIREGLASGRKVVCVADGGSTRRILRRQLRDPQGAAAAERGQLVVRGSEAAYVAGGFFDPDRMLAWWPEAASRALEEGYPGLRVTGDVTWLARGLPGVEHLTEYERALDDTLAGTAASALCQYDRRRLGDDLLAEASVCHRDLAGPSCTMSPEAFRVLGSASNGFRLVGELDLTVTSVLADALGTAVADGARRLSLDLTALRFMDAAGASALIGPAVEHQVTLELRNPQPMIRKVLSILGADRLPAVRLASGRVR